MEDEKALDLSDADTSQQTIIQQLASTRSRFRIPTRKVVMKPVILPDLRLQTNPTPLLPVPPKESKLSKFSSRNMSLGRISRQDKAFSGFEDPSAFMEKIIYEDSGFTADTTPSVLRKPDMSHLKGSLSSRLRKVDSHHHFLKQYETNQDSDDSLNSEWQDKVLISDKTQRFFKRGYLLKKLAVLKNWQMRYFEVDSLKIYYARSKEDMDSNTKVKCINLITNPCEITSHKGIEFTISIAGSSSEICLRAHTVDEADDWVSFFTDLFSFAREKNSSQNVYMPTMETLNKADVLFEEEFLSEADTGDILLFKTGTFKAKMQRMITSSDYDHVALILRSDAEIHLFDSNLDDGVQMVTWQEFKDSGLYRNCARIAYRKLIIPNILYKEEIKEKLWEFTSHNIGKKYELSLRKVFRKASFKKVNSLPTSPVTSLASLKKGIILPMINPKPDFTNKTNLFSGHSARILPSIQEGRRDSQEGFFCSELIAAAYKSVGLLNLATSSSRYLPVSFSQKKDIGLFNGASFSCEYGLAQLNDNRFYTNL